MNSKKKLAALGFALFFVLMQNLSFAQTFNFSQENFRVTLPSLSDLNPNQGSPAPFYTLFLEYGNGRYTKEVVPDNQFVTTPKLISYTRPIPFNSNAVLNIVGHYDTTKPPRTLLAIPNLLSSGSTTLESQNYLTGKSIGFDYSDIAVVPGDTMTAVLTYKPDLPSIYPGQPGSGNYIVGFFYNNESVGGNIFSVFNDPATVFSFGTGTATKVDLKAIRTRGETAYISTDQIPHAGIPDQVFTNLDIAKTGYTNAIYFLIPASATIDEKNIFISMAPDKKNKFLHGMFTRLGATIIKYNSTTTLGQQNEFIDLDLKLAARDPNGIITNPHCFNRPGEDFTNLYNEPVTDTIKFQNDGAGVATRVTITMALPPGVSLPTSLPTTCKVAGREILLKNKAFFPTSDYTYQITPDRKIIFDLKNIQLKGTADAPRNERLRRGKITFKLKTYPNRTPSTIVPDCMYSTIWIVFYSGKKTNSPIIAWDLMRANCESGKACSRYTVNEPPRN